MTTSSKARIVSLIGLMALACAAIPATAASITYGAILSGAAENPPNASPGTGSTTITVDTVASTMRVQATFSGLLANTTAAHIHCCSSAPANAGVATQTPSFNGFPLGVTSGTFDNTFDMTDAASFRAGFITANGGTVGSAWAALMLGLGSGQAYFNIHTTEFPGGEIRGFLNEVPEPGTLALLGLGLAGLGIARRRRI